MSDQEHKDNGDNMPKDALQEAIAQNVANSKTPLPSYIVALSLFASIAGTYFKSQSNIEYLQKQQDAHVIKIERIEESINNQAQNYIRLDERLAGVQKELCEIKTLLKDALKNRYQ